MDRKLSVTDSGAKTDQMAMTAKLAQRARRHAPVLKCDLLEPFAPVMLGITLLSPGEQSPSTPHIPVGPEDTRAVIEYAIWWNGDIQHLYELEHVWVFLDEADQIVHVAASAHGGIFDMACGLEDGRPLLFCEPGKHAHADRAETIVSRRAGLDSACNDLDGSRGILINDIFAQALGFLTPYDHFLAREYLKSQQFSPIYAFSVSFDLASLPMLSWTELHAQIPRYLRDQMEGLRASRKGIKAIFVDSGDTLIDEGSQTFDAAEPDLVLTAQPIAGAPQLVAAIKEYDYPLALVADGRELSFVNVHVPLGFWDAFDARAISEICGVSKPDPAIFREAMFKLGLRESDADGIVFFGNNLGRDIRGGNALGMKTVWLDWGDRYPKQPSGEIEQPDFIVKTPLELLEIIEKLDRLPAESD